MNTLIIIALAWHDGKKTRNVKLRVYWTEYETQKGNETMMYNADNL